MKIATILEQYNTDQLREYLAQLHLVAPANRTKEALVAELSGFLLRPKVMMERLSVISEDDMDLLMQGLQEEVDIDDVNAEGAIRLAELDYAAITEDSTLLIPDDVRAAFEEIDLSEFLELRENNHWMRCCIGVLCTIYGAAPREILYKLFCTKRGKAPTFEEFWAKYRALPQDLNPCIDDGNIIYERFFAAEPSCGDRIKVRKMENYYIPTRDEIEEYAAEFCLLSEESYNNLLDFFLKQLDELDALHAVSDIYNRFAMGDDFADIEEWFNDWGIKFGNDIELKQVLTDILTGYYNTRMQRFQGHTYKEWIEIDPSFGDYKWNRIVADTETMADTLQKHEELLTRLGFEVDYQSLATEISSMTYPRGLDGDGAVVTTRKIYPRDICPCGSGKEYQFCCMSRSDN
ncbi:MAG: SEC-C domain-containing protein [Lachnospiraceae bacterium]|nr:SEC-C domain-containing protein [Lachnospiraceae bacterium]MBR5788810.1 SEC-C domain-containing protein [Lachnospiraceae bacterium]